MIEIPWWVKLIAVAALASASAAFGFSRGVAHLQEQWDAAKAVQTQAVAKQAAKVAVIESKQTQVTKEASDATDARISAIHAHYSGVRNTTASSSSPVRKVSGGPGESAATIADSGFATLHPETYDHLAERCAVTTAIAVGWQEWYLGQAQAAQ